MAEDPKKAGTGSKFGSHFVRAPWVSGLDTPLHRQSYTYVVASALSIAIAALAMSKHVEYEPSNGMFQKGFQDVRG